jgi:hypothetical protein
MRFFDDAPELREAKTYKPFLSSGRITTSKKFPAHSIFYHCQKLFQTIIHDYLFGTLPSISSVGRASAQVKSSMARKENYITGIARQILRTAGKIRQLAAQIDKDEFGRSFLSFWKTMPIFV